MKEVKIQIRVAVETREEWKERARLAHKTLTQYIVDKVEGAALESRKARKEVSKADSSVQNIDGFKTYFK